MTKDKTEQVAEVVEKEARRKILKGLAGIPAVMTLGSGSAHAIASVYECAAPTAQLTDRLGNPLEGAYTPNLNTDLSGNGTNDADCVNLNSVDTPPDGAPLEANVLYDNSGTTTVSPVRTRVDHDGNPANPDRACVVFVDADGQMFGNTQEPNTLPVTASCYVSFTS